ncbi:MAG: phosphate acyltransferase PlsX [bacterium]
MKIAVDAMGGDYAPDEIVGGAIDAISLGFAREIILVGNPDLIKNGLKKHKKDLPIEIYPSDSVIGMEESPISALRAKPNSSIAVSYSLVRKKIAGSVVSAGNTGASFIGGLTILGRLKGIDRPAIASPIPTKNGICILIDVGANVDSKPKHLFQFGAMGKVYASEVLRIKNPRVGILNIGEEEGKGNRLTDKASILFSKGNFNFCGNIEGSDILKGKADVVVCDGFVGNSILKFGEGVAEFIVDYIRNGNFINKCGLLFAKGLFKRLLKKIDYSEYGGAPLLGIKGVSIICHGKSKRKAIANAIRVAQESISHHINERIEEELRIAEELGI